MALFIPCFSKTNMINIIHIDYSGFHGMTVCHVAVHLDFDKYTVIKW